MELVVRGKRDVKPILLKMGFALALSFTGFLISHLRSRPRSKPPSGLKFEASSKGLKDELRILRSEESLASIINGTSTTTTTTTTTTKFVGLSPKSKSSGDEEGFLLPEFNELVLKEFEALGQDPNGTTSNRTPKKADAREEIAMEQEIVRLKNLVVSLRERERSLELQLLEYYGLEEQEAALRELESQVKINTMEAKIFSLRIKSLRAENQRLQAQLLDASNAMTELETARAKIKYLKRKSKTEGDDTKEKMFALQRKVSMLQSQVEMDERRVVDMEMKLKRLNELEEEAVNLKMLNSRLVVDNLELNRKLEVSLLEGTEEAKASEEAKRLREENDKLTKEIEQLQNDRYADVEQSVYLKWVNACLRYELRNYQAPPGKTIARDLSKTLSPRSEETAKQLIVEYANSGAGKNRLNSVEMDMEYYSSQASAGESDDTSNRTSYTARSSSSKSKFFSKLKKLVLGKDKTSSMDRTSTSFADSNTRASFSTYSADDMHGGDSCTSLSPTITEDLGLSTHLSGMEEAQIDGHGPKKHARSHGRPSLDVQGIRRQDLEDDRERKGEHYDANIARSQSFEKLSSFDEAMEAASQASSIYDKGTECPEKTELKKFADALKRSRGIPRCKKRT